MKSSRKQSSSRTPRKRRALRHEVMFSPSDFEVLDGGRRVRLKAHGAVSDRVGWPELPLATIRLALPDGARDVCVRVVKETWKAWPGTLQLAPAQEKRLAMKLDHVAERATISPPIPRNTRTPRDAFAPPTEVPLAPEVRKLKEVAAPTAELRSADHMAGNVLAAVTLAPLRWSPRTGRSRFLTRATLEVTWDAGSPTREAVPPLVAIDELRRLLSLVDNPLDVKRTIDVPDRFDVPDICPDDPRLTRPRRPGPIEYPIWDKGIPFIPPEIIFIPRFEDWPYVIVTDDTRWSEDGTRGAAVPGLVAAFRRLADWKSAKGVRARVVTVSDILANRFGRHWVPGTTRDVQEAIRNFLQMAYARWNTRWCLLGGDIDIVPIRHVLGDWNSHVTTTTTVPPPWNQANHTAGATITNFATPFVFPTTQVLYALAATTLGYRPGATAASPGWYYTTDNTFATASTTPTAFVTVRAPAAVLDGGFIAPQYGNLIPTDLYYASVDAPLYRQPGKHDWDLDGNGLYGWLWSNVDGVDWGADISVGRAPVDNATDAGTFVDKVLTYETFRDVRTGALIDGEFPRRYLGVGDVWGSNWWDATSQRASDGGMDGASLEKNVALDTLRGAGVAVDHSQRLLTDLFFDRRIATDLAPLTIPALRTALDAGAHFISVSGHGWWGGCCGLAALDTSAADAASMRNWPHVGIYFVDSCLTNEIDVEKWRPPGEGTPTAGAACLGKRVIRVSGGGAVAYAGYSRVGAVGYSEEQVFWRSLATPGQRHLGRMHDNARDKAKDRFAWQAFIMNLNGDPEMRVWTDAPRRLTVSHTASVYGKDRLTVTVLRAGAPVYDAKVCVSQITAGGEVTYFTMSEASGGHYTFDTSNAADGTIHVVVTGDNVIPHVGTAEKVSLPVSPAKHRTAGFVYDVAPLSGGASAGVLAASGDGTLVRLDGDLQLVRSTTLRGDGKPLVDLAVASDGSAVVATRDVSGDNLHLVSSAGAIVRSWTLGQEVHRVARSSDGNTVYAATGNTGVKAISRASGATLWSALKHGSHLAIGPSGRIYAGGFDTDDKPVVVCLNTDGSRRWTYQLGASWPSEPRSMVVHGDGRCVVGTRDHGIHAISATGVRLWNVASLSAAIVAVALDGDDLVAGFGDGLVERRSLADGSVRWSVDIGDRSDVIVTGLDRVYVGTWHGVRALDAGSGATAWLRETQGGVLSLALKGDRLYAGSRDGWVYRIDDPRRFIAVRPEIERIIRAGTVPLAPIETWPGIRRPPIPPPGPGPGPAELVSRPSSGRRRAAPPGSAAMARSSTPARAGARRA